MAYTVEWDNPEKTVLIQTYSGEITYEEYIEVVKRSAEHLNSVSHPVDVVIDFSEATSNIAGYLQGVRSANQHVPDNQRHVIVVGLDSVTQSFASVVKRIAPRATENIYFVDALKKAYEILEAKASE